MHNKSKPSLKIETSQPLPHHLVTQIVRKTTKKSIERYRKHKLTLLNGTMTDSETRNWSNIRAAQDDYIRSQMTISETKANQSSEGLRQDMGQGRSINGMYFKNFGEYAQYMNKSTENLLNQT